ncbi:MAG: galactitol-1-phosphate 5-dehydrogenase [Thermoguttaceae bacterium]|nr:galactitol-1-phosphate 5-dehydrogenase [Thermoguttaceae bacterium]MDW8077562.1 galactitol-1-phosphate 5-dehydrogenase [Thermoguttaceae bacterium]
MKALVLTAYNVLAIQEVPTPVPGEGEVLVKVRACGICGSDVHGLDGSTGRRIPPLIMGHEAAGEVAAVGPGVRSVAVGEAVTFDSTVWCGECVDCRRGRVNLCEKRQVLGVACAEFRRDGAFAEYVVVPERIIVRMPPGLSFLEATLAEPLAVAVHAVNRLGEVLGKSVAVIGTGIIGLLAVQVLKVAGCRRILAVDRDQSRLSLASKLGATDLFLVENSSELEEIANKVVERTDGGTDLAIEAVGLPETVVAAVKVVRKGGVVALVGNLRPEVPLPLQVVVTREITLRGSYASRGEYQLAVDLLASRKVAAMPLISAVAPLEEGPQWFEWLRSGKLGLLKVILEP